MGHSDEASDATALPQSGLGRRLIYGSIVTLCSRIFGMILQVVGFFLIVHLLDVRDVGIYAVVNAIWSIVRMTGPLGYDQATMRFVPVYLVGGREACAAGIDRASFRKVGVISTIVALLGLGVAIGAIEIGILSNMTLDIATIAATAVPAYSIAGLLAGQLRARHRVFWAQFPEAILFNAVFIAILAVAFLFGSTSLKLVLASQMVAAWSMVLLYTVLKVAITKRGRKGEPLPAEDRREIAATARWMLAAFTATILLVRSPTLLAATMLGSEASAIMETAFRFGILPTITTWAVNIVVSPMLAEAGVRGNRRELQLLSTYGSWLCFLPAVAILAALLLFGRWALDVLGGPAYSAAFWPTIFVTMAMVVNAAATMGSNLSFMVRHEEVALLFTILALVVQVIGVMTLGAALGIVGIAIAVLVAQIVRDVGVTIFMGRHLGIHPGVWSLAGVVQALHGIHQLYWFVVAKLRRAR